MGLIKLFLCLNALHLVFTKEPEPQLECSPDLMKVMVPLDGVRKTSYLDQMKDYTPCRPVIQNSMATYDLDLNDPSKCGVTRVLNKITGKKTFYHKVVIEDKDGDRQVYTVKCAVFPPKPVHHSIDKRAVEPLPLDFHEPDVVTITRVEEQHAPEPQLGVAVRQNGKQVSGEISVKPGTPLSMEIFLDNSSAPVYGLFANYMHVSDTGKQLETIILNGCSVDTYLFENFLTENGDKLEAKFRAFKFPDTSYVQFKGVVTVCLDKCQGVQCSNGVTGYGRRRRSVPSSHGGNMYEVSLTTFIRVGADKEAVPEPEVKCYRDLMKVTIPLDEVRETTYLDQMKDYKPCRPVIHNGMATYDLDLNDSSKCGVTWILNKMTGKKTFYQNIVVEDKSGYQEIYIAKCIAFPPTPTNHSIDKRAVEPLPLDFHEPDVVTITRVEEQHAPEPQLGIAVRQNGKQVSGEISVKSGTPLSLEIFLDNSSAPVYGLFVNYMHVSDTGDQLETVILNGCSVDSYLFDNFITENGDKLEAKFRAFKFPDTSYVQFKGVVTVCLDKCHAVQCSNGVTGYGRRRRSVPSSHGGNMYEVSLTTFIRVGADKEAEDVLELFKKFQVGNQMLADRDGTPATVAEKTADNTLILHAEEAASNSFRLQNTILLYLAFVILFFNKYNN